MNPRRRSRSTRGREIALAGLLLLGGLGGCTGPSPGEVVGAPAPDLPPGAVQVGRDLYQIPLGADADGCQMYRLYSPTLMVTEAISYRSRAGGFTIDRRAALCDRGASTKGAPGARAEGATHLPVALAKPRVRARSRV